MCIVQDNLHIVFYAFELFLFILPAIPESIYIRLAILVSYFISHIYKVQVYYLQFKRQTLYNADNNIDISKIY